MLILNNYTYLEKYKLLYLLILADIAFIVVDVLFSEDHKSLLAIARDLGYAEVYQYIKEFWIFALLATMALINRQLVYAAWALLFLYFLFDDSLQIHETVGRKIVQTFNINDFGQIKALTIGELVVSVVSGLILFSGTAISYVLGNFRSKLISKSLLVCVLGIVFFGVLVDTIHTALPGSINFWSRVEDGGEMIVMSLVAAFVFSLHLYDDPPT